ncbi:MAG: hypothetical protein P8X96_02290 [Desulfobacteraceae bacterium]|jgi:hypothetical protein
MKGLSLKDALFLGFCAVLIIAARAALRLHLKIPGHSMLFTLFFILLARGCVRNHLAASFTALLSGIMALLLGMGKGGPLILIKYLLPAMAVDVAAFILADRLFQSMLLCGLTAMLAAATRFLSDAAMDLLAGMEFTVMIRHATLQTASNMVFGGIGALGVPAVLRKLRAFGAIEPY